jgi:ubiquinol-cytochrome c reductase cytochrome b subunit
VPVKPRRAARAARRAALAADERFGAAGYARKSLQKVFPDHWSFLLGEVALYSFMLLILTGTFLTFFFQPSMATITYHGSYVPLAGVRMSEAYASTLRISFDVRGGLLIRQVHHWAALLFVAAVVLHLLRIFFTGAFRRPREINWLLGLSMFTLAIAEGFCGYSLPDDLLSGTGLHIADGVLLAIPVVGTYLSFWLFGGPFPGHAVIPRLYIVHVLLIPGLLLALITAHLMIVWYQGHTQWPGRRERDDNEVGVPLYPVFMAKTGALLFLTFGALAAAGALAQINPVWLFGPYNPANDSAGAQPDWYVGLAEGAIRLMPGWETVAAGHTVAWNVLVPAVLLPLGFVVAAAAYPFIEQWATGDRRQHQVLDRPRNDPSRTGLGAAAVTAGAILLLTGGDDLIAVHFGVPLFDLVWFFRAGFFVFPPLAFAVTRRACLGMQRRDRRALLHGVPTGKVIGLPDGAIVPARRPLTPAERAVFDARTPTQLMMPVPWHLIPLPTPRRVRAQVRARLNNFYTIYRLETVSSRRSRDAGAGDAEPGPTPQPGGRSRLAAGFRDASRAGRGVMSGWTDRILAAVGLGGRESGAAASQDPAARPAGRAPEPATPDESTPAQVPSKQSAGPAGSDPGRPG